MPRFLTALLVLPLLAGCGKSGSPAASSSAAGQSRTAYVTAANAICKDVSHSVDALPDPKGVQDFELALTGIVTILEEGQAKLRALQPPPADAAAIETNLLKPNDQQIALLKESIPKLRALRGEKDPKVIVQRFSETLKQFGEIGQAQSDWAKSFGLSECTE